MELREYLNQYFWIKKKDILDDWFILRTIKALVICYWIMHKNQILRSKKFSLNYYI